MLYLQMGMIFLFGAMLGSFLNVCIYRLPRKESVLWPGSHCPQCSHSIAIWDNIPILSYLILRGKCRKCKAVIPVRYLLVEILTGVLLLLLWRHYGFSLLFVHYGILTLFLLPISFIDIDTKLILNVLTFPGILLGVLLSIPVAQISLLQSLLGLLLGGGFLFLIGVLGNMLFKQESMGGGDIKLGAMIGAFMGPEVIIALFVSFFLALPVIAVGFGTRQLKIKSKLPFGPFISLGAVILVIFGQTLYYKYYQFMGYF